MRISLHNTFWDLQEHKSRFPFDPANPVEVELVSRDYWIYGMLSGTEQERHILNMVINQISAALSQPHKPSNIHIDII